MFLNYGENINAYNKDIKLFALQKAGQDVKIDTVTNNCI